MNGSYMIVTANGVLAICAVLTVVGGGLVLYVELAIRRAFERLDERYVRTDLCAKCHQEMLLRLGISEGD